MSYAEACAVLLCCWGFGYVLGFKLRQIQDALSAC